jgi:hypothetical protein
MFPKMTRIRQSFDSSHIADIPAAVRGQIDNCGVEWARGSSIAITVGSRGVANIALIVKSLVACLKEKGVEPFVIPAMGSHGGATAEGQVEVLAGYGVTEDYIGAPIRSSMETVSLPSGATEAKVYMDKNAWEADGVIVMGRIKLHTDFHGHVESGIMKMCVIGLGKHDQALEAHSFGARGLREKIPEIAREVIKSGKVKLGIGIVENAYDQTMIIEAIRPENIEKREAELLDISRANMPSLPADKLDVLIVDEIGKNISGAGMDTNIIGRIYIRGEEEPTKPDINTIIVADLSEGSHGNAAGMGLADITTQRLYEKIDFEATYENVLTSLYIQRCFVPAVADSDRQAFEYALRLNPRAGDNLRVARIKNTLRLSELLVSPALLAEIRDKGNIEVIGEPEPLLGENGDFAEF